MKTMFNSIWMMRPSKRKVKWRPMKNRVKRSWTSIKKA